MPEGGDYVNPPNFAIVQKSHKLLTYATERKKWLCISLPGFGLSGGAEAKEAWLMYPRGRPCSHVSYR
jgi:hypothetical protein